MELIKELNESVIDFENTIITVQKTLREKRLLDTVNSIEYKHILLKQFKTVKYLYNKAIAYNYTNNTIIEFLQYTNSIIQQFTNILIKLENILYY